MSLVTTSETKAGSALAKNGTEATKDRQLKLMTSWNTSRHKTALLAFGRFFSSVWVGRKTPDGGSMGFGKKE